MIESVAFYMAKNDQNLNDTGRLLLSELFRIRNLGIVSVKYVGEYS